MAKVRQSPRRGGFTFVELLVVLAIIAMLIAMLMPTLQKVRRRAVVFATPIVSANELAGVDMLNPRGTRVELSPAQVLCWDSEIQGPVWSPNGTWVGHTIHFRNSAGKIDHELVVVNASTGEIHRYASLVGAGSRFTGWADNEHFIEIQRQANSFTDCTFYIRDAASGTVSYQIDVPGWHDPAVQITPVPPQTGAFYVSTRTIDDGFEIVLLRKNFSVEKTVYRERGGGFFRDPAPRVDPFGEFVAWNGERRILFKPLYTPPSDLPSTVPTPYGSGAFCDWTEDGRILAECESVTHPSRLVILDRFGRVYAEIPGGAASANHHGTACWRKYMRR